MSVRVELHPLAAGEIADAEDWYERQRSGLGARLLEVVEATVNRASRSPRTGTPVVVDQQGSAGVRKMPLGGFPWALAYEITEESIVVLAPSTNADTPITGWNAPSSRRAIRFIQHSIQQTGRYEPIRANTRRTEHRNQPW